MNPELLLSRPNAANVRRVTSELGPLTGYLCNDRTIRGAGLRVDRPPMPDKSGSCSPLFGVSEEFQNYLLPGFFLPLRWRSSATTHDSRLPRGLLRLADVVRQAFVDDRVEGADQCSLQFCNSELGWPNISTWGEPGSSLPLGFASAFGSLAAGLESCLSGIKQDPEVLVSAAWDQEFVPVDRLSQKLTVATHWQLNTAKVYVARGQSELMQHPTAELLVGGQRITLVELGRSDKARPRESLSGFFAEAMLKPDPSNAEDCYAYHDRLREFDRQRAGDYYMSVLVEHLIRHCQRSMRFSSSLASQANPSHLVTIATFHHQPIQLIADSLDVENVLVLFTPQSKSVVGSTVAALTQQGRRASQVVTAGPLPDDYRAPDHLRRLTDEIVRHVAEFTEGVPEEKVIFDIDRGLTLHKLALTRHAVKPHNLIASLLYESKPGATIVQHGTELLSIWPAREGSRPSFA